MTCSFSISNELATHECQQRPQLRNTLTSSLDLIPCPIFAMSACTHKPRQTAELGSTSPIAYCTSIAARSCGVSSLISIALYPVTCKRHRLVSACETTADVPEHAPTRSQVLLGETHDFELQRISASIRDNRHEWCLMQQCNKGATQRRRYTRSKTVSICCAMVASVLSNEISSVGHVASSEEW